jgi:hypothetical protein
VSLNRKGILKSAACGAALGALLLFFFGEGFAMALYLAFEGALMGFVIGGVGGIVTQFVTGTLIPKRRDLP